MEAAAMALNQKVVDKLLLLLLFFKGLRRGGGSLPGHLVTASLTVSLFLSSCFSHFSLPLPFSLPFSFLRFFPFTLLLFFFFPPPSLSLCISFSNFLSQSCCVPWFLLSLFLSPFHSLAFSLSLDLSSIILNFLTWVTLKLRMATLYTSNLETVKEATVNLDTWVKVKNN